MILYSIIFIIQNVSGLNNVILNDYSISIMLVGARKEQTLVKGHCFAKPVQSSQEAG